jgi:hypothetical protein
MGSALEAMLRDNEPDLPFALHWANEPWVGSWQKQHAGESEQGGQGGGVHDEGGAGAGENSGVWSKGMSEKKGGGGVDVLLQQSYEQHTWAPHFQYLLPFFQHKNCIRIDGKPVIMIYRLHQLGSGKQV